MIEVESAHYQNEPSQHVQATTCAAATGGGAWQTLLNKPNPTFSQPSPVDSNRGSYSPNLSDYNNNTNNSYISEAAISMESDSAFTSYTNGPYNHVVDCGAFDSVDSPSKRRRLRLMTGQCYKKTDHPIYNPEGNTRSSISNQRIIAPLTTTIPSYAVTSQHFVQSPIQYSSLLEQAGYQPPSPISRQNTSSSREFDVFSSSLPLTCPSVNEGIGSEGTQVVSAKHEPVYILHRKRPRHDSGLGYVEPLLLENEQEFVSDCSRTLSKDSIHKNGPFRPMAIPRSSSLPVASESAPVYAVKHSESSDYSILRMIPSLISEKHRKAAFVENLVDTAALIIDVVWSKFTVNPRARLIPMRVFLQQTLRRSRTSYSTLQTALFYLFRIKPQIEQRALKPRGPPTPCDKGSEDSGHNTDPATCGRRMFLAALIIASKYLQDSNYSNRAWSKISGLPLQEINENEVIFLRLIDYKLFIAEDVFKRWSSLLLTHIQAISGSDMDNANAFRLKENQQSVELFRDTLRKMVI